MKRSTIILFPVAAAIIWLIAPALGLEVKTEDVLMAGFIIAVCDRMNLI
jgi:hypothetical protein